MKKASRFEDVYSVKDSYRRFDRSDTAFELEYSKTGSRTLKYDEEEGRIERMRKNLPGYSLLDYTFTEAAHTYAGPPHLAASRMNEGYYSWTPLGVTRKPDEIPMWKGSPEVASRVVTKAAKYFGAAGVGFCGLDRRWIYSHTSENREIVFEDVEEPYVTDEKAVIPESHKWVIALTIPMEINEMKHAPTILNPTTYMGYSRMHVLAGTLAEFIRGLGYPAIPCGNDTALSIPIAIQAGLGHIGRHGRLITWDHGPMVRICKIFTDLPLASSPLASMGLIEFCEVCKKCAIHCPSKSIPYGPRTYQGQTKANNPGVLKWYCNAESCLEYWGQVGTNCSICLRTCSFTKPNTLGHKIVKWSIRNIPQLNRFWVWSDDILGYGKMADPRKYWTKN